MNTGHSLTKKKEEEIHHCGKLYSLRGLQCVAVQRRQHDRINGKDRTQVTSECFSYNSCLLRPNLRFRKRRKPIYKEYVLCFWYEH